VPARRRAAPTSYDLRTAEGVANVRARLERIWRMCTVDDVWWLAHRVEQAVELHTTDAPRPAEPPPARPRAQDHEEGQLGLWT
jgi:hypothetical protein